MKLNLGCGRFHVDGYVNVDNRPLPTVDVVADLSQDWPWDDDAIDVVRASHILEHIPDVPFFMAQAHRVLAPHGVLDITVPHGNHINAWTDPTHRRAFTPLSMEFWTGNPDYEQYGPRFGERAVIESTDEIRWILMKEAA